MTVDDIARRHGERVNRVSCPGVVRGERQTAIHLGRGQGDGAAGKYLVVEMVGHRFVMRAPADVTEVPWPAPAATVIGSAVDPPAFTFSALLPTVSFGARAVIAAFVGVLLPECAAEPAVPFIRSP